MNKKYCTQEELQEELGITSFDLYQYSRRGLKPSVTHPGLYELNETREWIRGFRTRERNRWSIKDKLLKDLSEKELEIVSKPKWNAQYGVLWHNDDNRRKLTIQRVIYLIVQSSTSHAYNMVYISQTLQEAQYIQETMSQTLGEAAEGFQSLTMPKLAELILMNEKIQTESFDELTKVLMANELLENSQKLQEKYGYIYRQFFVEKLETLSNDELYLLHLLLNHFGEGMFNVGLSNLNQSQTLKRLFHQLEEIHVFEN